jgi:hypothetical protein
MDITNFATIFVNEIINDIVYKNLIKNFAINYINNLLDIVFYSPLLLQDNFHLTKLDNYNKEEICMLCNEKLNIEIINYKCKACSCHLHHNCANIYFSNYIVNNCMQCKIEYNKFKKYTGISLYFEWSNSIITNINIRSIYINTTMTISTINYKYTNTNKKMRDYQIAIYRDKVLYKVVTLEPNNNIYSINDTTYVANVYINNVVEESLLFVKSIENITSSNPIIYL